MIYKNEPQQVLILDLVEYLLENHIMISSYPVCGDIKSVYALFCKSNMEKNNFDYDEAVIDIERESRGCYIGRDYSYADFKAMLFLIENIEPGCFDIELDTIYGDRICNFSGYLLDILHTSLGKTNEQNNSKYTKQTTVVDSAIDVTDVKQENDITSRLFTVLNMCDNSENENENENSLQNTCPNAKIYYKLQEILRVETGFKKLHREKLQYTLKPKLYISICNDVEHARKLERYVKIQNNKVMNVADFDRINILDLSKETIDCFKTRIHYVINLKQHTDKSLGDCSYLDTCHKLNSCRYIHYLQYNPNVFKRDKEQGNLSKVLGNKEYEPSGLFTHGENVKSKTLLPKQWIRCDVRKFDFNILGKFSCVIADPAWNIHMNLPYGTCNDNELLQMPLNVLQDEGIFFLWVTGRSVELGKESLEKWGYKVINELSWIKINQLGRTIVTGRTGHWLNHSKEHLLVGIKGSPKWLNRQQDIDLIVSYTRETSRKPDELYGMCERLCGKHARKLEIFGRDHNTRPGWFTIGNQLKNSCVHEVDVKRKYESWLTNQPDLLNAPQTGSSSKFSKRKTNEVFMNQSQKKFEGPRSVSSKMF